MLCDSIGVSSQSLSLRGAPATPSPPRRSRRAAPGRSPKRRSRTRRGARDRSRRRSSRYALVSPRASPPRWPVRLSIKAIRSSMDTGCGCLRLEPKALAPLARLRHHAPADARLHGRRLARFRPPPPADGVSSAPPPPRAAPGPRAASAPSSREVKGTARGTGAPVCAAPRHGAGRVRGRGIAQSWHRFR